MLVADKGTMGVGSSRMSGVNNVALWIGKESSKYVPFINLRRLLQERTEFLLYFQQL